MRAILIDLETWPALTPEMRESIRAELEAEAAEVKAPKNYKDETKIAAYVEAERKRILDKAGDINDKAALKKITGAICLVTIGSLDGPDDKIVQMSAPALTDERKCIDEALCYLSIKDTGAQIVTYNGTEFDLPFLKFRAMSRRVSSPWPIPRSKDWTRHLDLYLDLGKPGTLDQCALAILGRGKGEITGADVPRLWASGPEGQEKVREYARNEMELLIGIYRAYREVTMPELLK